MEVEQSDAAKLPTREQFAKYKDAYGVHFCMWTEATQSYDAALTQIEELKLDLAKAMAMTDQYCGIADVAVRKAAQATDYAEQYKARALAAEQDVETAHARVDNLCSRLPHCWS